MNLPDSHSKHQDAFEDMVKRHFPTAHRAAKHQMAIAFCAGLDAAGGKPAKRKSAPKPKPAAPSED